MKLEDFNIDLNKFQNDSYQFSLNLNDTFFTLKENSLFNRCKVKAQIECTKLDSTVTLTFSLNGIVGTQCERCLNSIELNSKLSYIEVYKITSDRELLAEENYISESQHELNVYDSLYESICTHLPTRLICENAVDSPNCEVLINNTQNESVDPRWDKLKKLIK